MTTTTQTGLRNELLRAEQVYFSAVIAREDSAIRALSAPECMVAGPSGAQIVERDAAADMVRNHDGEQEYAIDEDTVTVVAINDSTGAISYRLDTTAPGAEKSSSFDTTVWTRDIHGDWHCALHVSTPASSEPDRG